ncbi:hypothetical protein GGR56DRAFT_690449 [Xylariaceae sp. FL0804]|nr:hypothetical protein GGR56DRAFT_690449 [Xylariaceae sp. FL0804]
MTIITGVPGLEVDIWVGGRKAREYLDPDQPEDGPGAMRCAFRYIESEGGKAYTIRLRATKNYAWGYKNHSINFAIYIDGQWVRGELCRAHNTYADIWECEVATRIISAPGYVDAFFEQNFTFKGVRQLENASSEQIARGRQVAQNLGQIEVRVFRVREDEGVSYYVPEGDDPRSFRVPSKSMKGKATSHGTIYDRKQHTKKPSYLKCKRLQEDDGPIAFFRFRYRSREALRKEGITSESATRPEDPQLAGLDQGAIQNLAVNALQRQKQDAHRRRLDEAKRAKSLRRPVKRETLWPRNSGMAPPPHLEDDRVIIADDPPERAAQREPRRGGDGGSKAVKKEPVAGAHPDHGKTITLSDSDDDDLKVTRDVVTLKVTREVVTLSESDSDDLVVIGEKRKADDGHEPSKRQKMHGQGPPALTSGSQDLAGEGNVPLDEEDDSLFVKQEDCPGSHPDHGQVIKIEDGLDSGEGTEAKPTVRGGDTGTSRGGEEERESTADSLKSLFRGREGDSDLEIAPSAVGGAGEGIGSQPGAGSPGGPGRSGTAEENSDSAPRPKRGTSPPGQESAAPGAPISRGLGPTRDEITISDLVSAALAEADTALQEDIAAQVARADWREVMGVALPVLRLPATEEEAVAINSRPNPLALERLRRDFAGQVAGQ